MPVGRRALGALLFVALSVGGAAAQTLPIPGVPAAQDVPGAKMLPNPKVEYKVLFDAARETPKAGEVNPILLATARYLNTLAKHGVPPANRKLAVVFHQGATDYIMDNDAYKARHGQDNPNVAMIRDLKKAGVEFHVCGQAVLGRKIDPKTIMPEIQLDLWALTTIIELETAGYVRIGG